MLKNSISFLMCILYCTVINAATPKSGDADGNPLTDATLFGDIGGTNTNVGGIIQVIDQYGPFATTNDISAENQNFSNAVLQVGIGIDTNTVTAINELIEEDGSPLPSGGTTTVGTLLLALAVAVAVLRRNKFDSSSVAAAFDEEATYPVDSYVTHNGRLYRCMSAVTTAGAWDASKWTAVAITDEMGADTQLPFDAECEYVTFPAGAYVDPEIVDIGLPNAYDIDARIRIPVYGYFRSGNWRGNSQDQSFMIFNYSGGGYKIAKYGLDSESGITVTSDFFDIKTTSTGYTLNGVTRSITPTTPVRSNAAFIICGLDNAGTMSGSEVDVDIAYFRFIGNTVFRALVPVRVGMVGYLYDKVSGRLFGSAVGSIPLVPGPDKT